jgi:hypothetical protein
MRIIIEFDENLAPQTSSQVLLPASAAHHGIDAGPAPAAGVTRTTKIAVAASKARVHVAPSGGFARLVRTSHSIDAGHAVHHKSPEKK